MTTPSYRDFTGTGTANVVSNVTRNNSTLYWC